MGTTYAEAVVKPVKEPGAYTSIPVTKAANVWYTGTNTAAASSYGVEVRQSGTETTADWNTFYTSDAGSNPPKLVINYEPLAQVVNFTSQPIDFIHVNSTGSQKAEINPPVANMNVTWSSSNTNVARVGSVSNVSNHVVTSGTVVSIYGISKGKATITARSAGNSTVYETFEVNVGYNFTMVHYYDNGYATRFSNPATAIASYQSTVATKFMNIFSLKISSSIMSYTSSADQCAITSIYLPCTHSVNHKSNEKLKEKLMADKGDGTNVLSRYVWTGHDGNGERSESTPPDSNSYRLVITPYGITTGTGGIRFVLLHETSHQLGVWDHYCYETTTHACNNPNCYKHVQGLSSLPQCVMSDWYNIETTSESTLYCSSCKSIISTHLANHH